MDRTIRIYTGIGGYDLFQEAVENGEGFYRIYIGKKVLRILRGLNPSIRKSVKGKYYKLSKKNG